MRTRVGKDANSGEICWALEQVGASVVHLDAVGGGVPDKLVGYKGANLLLELKAAKGKPRASQVEFQQKWRGQMAVVRTVAEALDAIGVMVSESDLARLSEAARARSQSAARRRGYSGR